MRPKEHRESGEHDLFRSRLDQIIDMDHALVKLAGSIDWHFLEERLGAVYTDKPGHPPLPTRLMAGLAILKHMHDLSDEVLCDRWVENPYFQYFCGLAVAARTEAVKPSDLARVVIDTTVQPKAVMFPTDAKLINRARERLVRLANQCGVDLRQSYRRVGKLALIKHQRYAHAHQFKRANKALRKLKTYLGRVIRDIGRRIAGNDALEEAFARELTLARRVRDQDHGQRGPKVYSLHAPEVECIGKGKAHRPYEFGVKVSVVTPLHRSRGGQFIAHVAALPGNPYDGHTLATVIPAMQALVGSTLERAIADAGYRGHNAPPDYKFRVFTAGQKRRVTPQIKREFKRRAAIEPVIGHLKAEHRMGRNHLAHRAGDAINAVLAAVGYNFRLLIRWLRFLLHRILLAFAAITQFNPA